MSYSYASVNRFQWAMVPISMVVTAAVTSIVLILVRSASFDVWGGLLVAPVLIGMSIPIIKRAVRGDHERMFSVVLAALIARFAATFARQYVAFSLYGGTADASEYDKIGKEIAHGFWAGNFSTGLETLTGTDFMRFLSGLVYSIVGPTRVGAFMFFSWLAFIGVVFLYRAYRVAFPEERSRLYVGLIFFAPSMLFWPSSLGKEAWMLFALGIAGFGAAQLLSGRARTGLVHSSVGIFFAFLMRPHVAGMIPIALTAAYLLRPARRELGVVAPVAKVAASIALVVMSVILVGQTTQFLEQRGIDLGSGVQSALQTASGRTDEGGSEFEPVVVSTPLHIPLAAFTVLFRPFPFEANNLQALIVATEATFLLLLSILRWRYLFGAIRSARSHPYLGFALTYSVLFVFAFSAVANFGLLARERIQVFPLYLVLLAIPSGLRVGRSSRERRRTT